MTFPPPGPYPAGGGPSLQGPPPGPVPPGWGGAPAATGRPDNSFGLAVAALAVAVSCSGCLAIPVGIYALILSNRVGECWARGDWAGAQESAGKARSWAVATFWVTGLSWVVAVVGYVAAVALGSAFGG